MNSISHGPNPLILVAEAGSALLALEFTPDAPAGQLEAGSHPCMGPYTAFHFATYNGTPFFLRPIQTRCGLVLSLSRPALLSSCLWKKPWSSLAAMRWEHCSLLKLLLGFSLTCCPYVSTIVNQSFRTCSWDWCFRWICRLSLTMSLPRHRPLLQPCQERVRQQRQQQQLPCKARAGVRLCQVRGEGRVCHKPLLQRCRERVEQHLCRRPLEDALRQNPRWFLWTWMRTNRHRSCREHRHADVCAYVPNVVMEVGESRAGKVLLCFCDRVLAVQVSSPREAVPAGVPGEAR